MILCNIMKTRNSLLFYRFRIYVETDLPRRQIPTRIVKSLSRSEIKQKRDNRRENKSVVNPVRRLRCRAATWKDLRNTPEKTQVGNKFAKITSKYKFINTLRADQLD